MQCILFSGEHLERLIWRTAECRVKCVRLPHIDPGIWPQFSHLQSVDNDCTAS